VWLPECTPLRDYYAGSFQKAALRKSAEDTVKHRSGGVGSVVANYRGGGGNSVVCNHALT